MRRNVALWADPGVAVAEHQIPQQQPRRGPTQQHQDRGRLAGGAAFLSPRLAHRVIDRFRSGPRPDAAAQESIAALSARERDVLALVGAGRANSEVARELYLAEGTVKGYVSAILSKLGAANRVQAATLAHHAEIIAE
ncbi:helix-turn-helix transcriptional regulator [Brevibacterium antiquum]|uniref:helix-turn-helix transcriptional regulator n=1 Tax=Brevibacterium antiquum TaxID=234835 RepID=UPI0018DF68BF